MSSREWGESSADVRKRVEKVQEIQKDRYRSEKIQFNGELKGEQIERFCRLDSGGQAFLQAAFEHMAFSPRAYHRILKVARTIADMDGTSEIRKDHVGEAVSYRAFDKKYWT